jgi:signal transduction histidine kinase
MITVAVKPAEPGSWWLVLLGGLAGQATRVTEADRADLLAAAEESLDRLAHLAVSLLDVSRLQAGAQAVFPLPTELGKIVAAWSQGHCAWSCAARARATW